MEAVKHTPGPWFVDPDFKVWTGALGIAYDDGRSHVAHTTRGFEGEDGEGWANARLIAAAPEMYEALIRVRNWVNTCVPIGTEAATTMLRVVTAAIAKAEGR